MELVLCPFSPAFDVAVEVSAAASSQLSMVCESTVASLFEGVGLFERRALRTMLSERRHVEELLQRLGGISLDPGVHVEDPLGSSGRFSTFPFGRPPLRLGDQLLLFPCT